MKTQSVLRSRVLFGLFLASGLTATPLLAQTSAPAAPEAPAAQKSETVAPAVEAQMSQPPASQPTPSATGPRLNQPPPITNQAEWQQAVARTVRRRAAPIARDPALRELDGRFEVKISFSLSPEGNASDAKITGSSGQPLVDAAALKIFDGDLKFPAFTPDMNRDKPMKLTAPLFFVLTKPEVLPEPAAKAR